MRLWEAPLCTSGLGTSSDQYSIWREKDTKKFPSASITEGRWGAEKSANTILVHIVGARDSFNYVLQLWDCGCWCYNVWSKLNSLAVLGSHYMHFSASIWWIPVPNPQCNLHILWGMSKNPAASWSSGTVAVGSRNGSTLVLTCRAKWKLYFHHSSPSLHLLVHNL